MPIKDTMLHTDPIKEKKAFLEGKIILNNNHLSEVDQKVKETNKKVEKFRPQGTFYALYPTWIHNNQQNLPNIKPSQDIKNIPKKTFDNVLIFGSGYTLTHKKVQKEYKTLLQNRKNCMILAAHSNLSFLHQEGLIPNIIFETDCSPKIVSQFEEAFSLPLYKKIFSKNNPNAPTFVLASHVSPKTVEYVYNIVPPHKIFFYKPFINSPSEATVYNNIQTVLLKPLSTYLLQAGCVTNGMFILSEFLHKSSIWTFSHIHFFGVDYCVFPPDGGRCPRYAYDEETKEIVELTHKISPIVEEHMFNYSGYWTTDKDLAYAYDFMNLLEGITRDYETKKEKFSVQVHGNSLAHRFCLFRPVLETEQ